MQRTFDVFFSGLALTVLSPVFLVIMIILKFTGEGEVFFRQIRIGKGKQPFQILKFATMLKDSPNIGPGTVTIRNDPRVLPVGRILRKTKINELPQLINIFVGDMSVIGPRPVAIREYETYSENTQRKIATVAPGLSGIGSIVFRDEESLMQIEGTPREFYKRTIGPYKGELEAWYVENQGIYLYFACIMLTVWVVIFPQSRVVWKLFKELPEPPEVIRKPLGYV